MQNNLFRRKHIIKVDINLDNFSIKIEFEVILVKIYHISVEQ